MTEINAWILATVTAASAMSPLARNVRMALMVPLAPLKVIVMQAGITAPRENATAACKPVQS